MVDQDNISDNENQTDVEKSDQPNQEALGNTKSAENGNEESLSIPKTTGTGSNPAGSTPNSLIVHGDKTGKDRYDVGENAEDQK